MTQLAQVKSILAGGLTEVMVQRKSACSHDCSKCAGESCMMVASPPVVARADNHVGAVVGDRVLVETHSGKLLGVVALVYIMPMVFLIAGFIAAQSFGLTQGFSILVSLAAFAVSLGLVLLLDRFVRRHQSLKFHIVEVRNA